MSSRATHISEWTVQEVGKVISEEKDLQHHSTKFVENKIDGKLLMQLNERELEQDLKIENGIERKKIMSLLNTHAKLDHHSCPLYPVVNPYDVPSGAKWTLKNIEYSCARSMILSSSLPDGEMEEMLSSMREPAAWWCGICNRGASPYDVCYYCKRCKYGECASCFYKN